MKKNISVVVVIIMILCLFSGCESQQITTDTSSLANQEIQLDNNDSSDIDEKQKSNVTCIY